MRQFNAIVFVAVFTAIVVGTGQANEGLIDFEDGATQGGVAIGSYYQSLGVTFSNGIWITADYTGNTDNEFWDGNAGLGVENGVYSPNDWAFPGSTSPIVVSFNSPMYTVSIEAFDVGNNGAGIEAYDANGNLLTTDYAQGSDIGSFNNVTLTVTGGDIWSIQLDRPYYVSGYPDGLGWDNLSFNSSAVPETSSLLLAAFGLVAFAVACVRRMRMAK